MGIVVNRHTCVRISLLCPYMISFCWSHNKHGWIMLGCTCCEVSTLCANHSHQECWMNTFCTQTLSHFGYSWLTMTFNLVHICFSKLLKQENEQTTLLHFDHLKQRDAWCRQCFDARKGMSLPIFQCHPSLSLSKQKRKKRNISELSQWVGCTL